MKLSGFSGIAVTEKDHFTDAVGARKIKADLTE
jgi:hypothetical protein